LRSVGSKSFKPREHIYPEYISRMGSVKFSAVINKVSQTKRTRNIPRSQSLL